MLIIFMASLIFLPMDTALNLEERPFGGFSPFVTALDLICMCDIVISFFTGYGIEETKEIILEPKKIAKYVCIYFLLVFLLLLLFFNNITIFIIITDHFFKPLLLYLRNYAIYGFFWVDLVSSIPSEFIAFLIVWFGGQHSFSKYLEIISLLKIVRLRTTLTYLSRSGDVSK